MLVMRMVPGMALVANNPKIEQMKKKMVIPPPSPMDWEVLLKWQEAKKLMPDTAKETMKLPNAYKQISTTGKDVPKSVEPAKMPTSRVNKEKASKTAAMTISENTR